MHGGDLGYAPDAADLEAALGGRYETDHFVIFHARTPEIEQDIDLIAADHEYRYAQVVALLGAAPPGKIHSYYFANRDQKARLMGARNVEMAKPWRREIYLDHRTFPHNSLRHEIAHAIASAFGDPIFGVAARRILGLPVMFSPGLIEGLAVAADWPGSYDRLTPHEAARAMQKLGNLPSLDTLLGIGFFTSSSSERSYAAAGSFLRFLLDEYGAASLRELYRSGGDFEGAYGVPRAPLEARWLAMLETVDVPQSVVDASQERFRGGGLLSKPCPHAIAARKERADRATDKVEKVELLADVCSDAPDEPRYLLDLANALYDLDTPLDRARAEGMWLRLAINPYLATTSVRAQAYQRLARAAYKHGDLAAARDHMAALLALSLEPGERRMPEGMAFALHRESPAGPTLREYFFGDSSLATAERIVAIEPRLALGHYLVGLQAYVRADWPRAARELAAALEGELPSHAFVKNAARILAPAAYRSHDRARLGIAISVLSRSDMSTGDRLFAVDWAERLSR
ncbi:MAG: hypothetical protein KIT31_40905, partial [Deltaproteobacteria bacterium]|nr:hypothetical protein [Deltaproteobacteria bacterium]